MAAGLYVGAGFLALAGAKAVRNVFSNGEQQEAPHTKRMDGVVDRLCANPRLLEQYNEKYIEKKLESNSVLRRTGSSNQITRTRSQELQRRASSRAEKVTHTDLLATPIAGA